MNGTSTLITGAWVVAFGVLTAGVAAAQQCPEWQLNGVPITTDADTAWTAQQYGLYAGGMLDLSSCSSVPGVGHITRAPNFSLTYDDRNMGRDLELRVESECDTTLLVNTATAGWEFNEDQNGLNPGLRLAQASSGRYDVWVGTWDGQSCAATLIAETFPSGSSAGGASAPGGTTCPDWSLGGAEVHLSSGESVSRPVTAGGPLSLFDNACNVPAHGYVTAAPDISLYFDNQNQTTALDIRVQGSCDETLLMNDNSAQWQFNDDDADLHPRLQIGDAASGRYDIWVGTFSQQDCQATISINAGGAQGGAPAQGK